MTRLEFIEAMRADGVVLDASRVSRWETGDLTPSPRVIAAYERRLELPYGSLMSVQALIRRASRADAHPPTVPHPGAVDLDRLFDLVERRQADGGHWLQLATDLTTYEQIYLHPSAWRAMCSQLIDEMSRSGGIAMVRRYEAAMILLHDARSRRHLAMSLGEYVMDSDAHNVMPALSLLGEFGDKKSTSIILRLVSCENNSLRAGALGVASAMLADGHFADEGAHTLEAQTLRELHDKASLSRMVDAVDLVAHLPDDNYARIVSSVPDPDMKRMMLRARETQELAPPDVARAVAEGVATYCEAVADRAAHDPDRMLRRLVREALFDVRRWRREQAAVLLSVSPYGHAVAESALRLTGERDLLVAGVAWRLLLRCSDVFTVAQVAGTALAEDRPQLQVKALQVLGIGSGPMPDQVADYLLHTVRTHPRASLRHASVFALGMKGHPHLEILGSKDQEQNERAARWWLRTGPAIHEGQDLPSDASSDARQQDQLAALRDKPIG